MDEKESSENVQGFQLLVNHIHAMFLKLTYNTIRNKGTGLIQIIWPIMNIILSIVISSSWKFLSELPPLLLSLEKGFEKTQTLVAQGINLSDASLSAKTMMVYKNYFKNSNNPGMSLSDVGTMDLGKFYLKLCKSDQNHIRYETLIGATFNNNNITAWFNNYGYHDSAISLALVDNSIMQTLSPNSTLNFVNYPLPYSFENMIQIMATGTSTAFLTAFNLGFCLAIISSFLVIFYIKERVSGAKLLQRVSGLKPAVMWLTAYIWDWMWLLVISIIMVTTLACFQENTMATPDELGRILLILMVFSFAMIPVHYLASFFFVEAATGFAKMVFVNIFSGPMVFLAGEILRMPQLGIPFYAKLTDYMFSFLPIYCFSRSLRELSVTSITMKACDDLCRYLNEKNCTRLSVCKQLDISACCIEDNPYFSWEEPGIARYLFMMFVVGITAFSILLIKEYEFINKVFYKSRYKETPPIPPGEDSDVDSERKLVNSLTRTDISRHSLVCRDLTKFYNKFRAVNRLTFAVRRGECFGLLGVNGAGKTTTFRMLTGDTRISIGDAFVLGHNVKTNIQDVHRNIGYCSQFDALFDNLTARETLRIFCLLRGIPEQAGAVNAMRLATSLGFVKHYDKKIHQDSGGTKRKISTAIALIGDSPIIFLDEPTTGMDPASKRLVWSAIIEAVECGRSVVLSSHSMEECEALCSRLTVMVRGALRCLGSLQHLKNKFSQGYTIMTKCESANNSETDLDMINQYMKDNFTSSRLIESYLGINTYYVQDSDLPWWRVFHIMEEACKQFPLEDYSVSQTTLEQVFLGFTR